MMVAIASAVHAQTVLLLHRGERNSDEVSRIQELVDWSGLKLESVDAASAQDLNRRATQLGHLKVLAVFVDADALSAIQPGIRAKLRKPDGAPAPVLIFGITAATDERLIQAWTGEAVRRCVFVDGRRTPKLLHVFSDPLFTRVLAGIDLPAVDAPVCRMEFGGAGARSILTTTGDTTAAAVAESTPTLVESRGRRGDVFLVPGLMQLDRRWAGQSWSLSDAFSSFAPFLFFLNAAAGDYAWRLDGQYANLTIDDPWLAQPYGNLDYGSLLAEMEKHRFHTTIAFVPWNYDRSDPGVARLLQAHPQYFSVCLHGNNHIHREFDTYADDPLAGQVANIKQGIARMEQFQQLTGIRYDRFMVFPHGIAPEATLAALKTYGFLGTANSLNVPLDKPFPTDPIFLLRSYTTSYGGLLSLSRYSVEAPVSQRDIAIQSFLGNPVLFYAHQGFFAGGAAAFNPVAETVNRIQPETKWVGLGELSRHLYQIRRREDGSFDVRMLSSEMALANPTSQEQVYHVSALTGRTTIAELALDSVASTFQQNGDTAEFVVRVPPHATRSVRIQYVSDLDLGRQDIAKRDLRGYLLRYISDFRDMQLSTQAWGRSVVGSYYAKSGGSIELFLERRWYLPAAVAVGCLILMLTWMLRRRTRTVKEGSKMGTSVL
jgi:hypothetical protein